MGVLRAQQRVGAVTAFAGQPATMSSREIAELTGKRHRDVLRDIRRMLGELGLAERNFARGYLDANGQERPEFALPKHLTLTLTSGYATVMRHRIVTRWMALEAGAPRLMMPAGTVEPSRTTRPRTRMLSPSSTDRSMTVRVQWVAPPGAVDCTPATSFTPAMGCTPPGGAPYISRSSPDEDRGDSNAQIFFA